MPGRVVFAYEPREEHYNTLGAVHGGILTTVLDTVMGCAIHSKLDAGIAPSHPRAEDELRAPSHARVGNPPRRGHRRASGLTRVATAEAKLEGEDGTLYAHASSTWLIYDLAEKTSKKQQLAASMRPFPPPLPTMRRWRRATGRTESRSAGSAPGRTRASTARGGRAPRRDVRDLRAAAERDRRAAHGACAERLDPGSPDPLAPDAGLRHALAAGVRPRRHLDPERRREAARPRGQLAQGDRPRGLRRACLASPGRDRAHDHGPVPPAGFARLLRERFTWTTRTSRR